MQQEEGRFLRFQPFHLDALGDARCRLCACGEQDVSFASRWEELAEQREVVGIIEDEQPAGVILEPAFDCIDNELLFLLLLLGQVQQVRNGHEVREDGCSRFGLDPHNGVVVLLVAVGVFHAGLCRRCLPGHRRRVVATGRSCLPLSKTCRGAEHLDAAREERVALKRDIRGEHNRR